MSDIIKILVKPVLENLIKQIDKNNYWFIVTIILFIIFSIYTIIKYIPFYYSNRKIIKEIGKIDHENIKFLLENTETVRKLKDLKIESDNTFFTSSKKLNLLFRKNTITIKNKKEIVDQFISSYRKCSFDKFSDYMDAYEILHKNNKDKIHAFIKYDLSLLFENIYTFITIVNQEFIRNISERGKYIIDESEIFHYYIFVKRHTRFYNFRLRKNFNNSLQKINLTIELFSLYDLVPKFLQKLIKTNSA